MCNAAFPDSRVGLILASQNDFAAQPADQPIDPFIGAACCVRMDSGCKYIVHHTYDISRLRHLIVRAGGVIDIENETAEGTGQTVQREYILMLLEKSPYLCLFPLPPLSQSFQR